MGHTHDHSVGHGHSPGDRPHLTRLKVALGITFAVFVLQVVGALWTHSLALLVDSGHMLTDLAGLAMAVFAVHLSERAPTSQRTWGFKRAEVLSALFQSFVLLGVGIFVLVEGIQRLVHPAEIAGPELLWFGVLGLIGNIAAITCLASQRDANFNLRAAFLEVVSDAIGSVAVIIAALVISLTGFHETDSIAALLIGCLIVPRAFKLLRETTNVLLESTPPGLNLDDVRAHLSEVEHVRAVHDLHASLIATGLPVLTAHIVVEDSCFDNGCLRQLLENLQECVATHFEISVEHSTFQFEPEGHQARENAAC